MGRWASELWLDLSQIQAKKISMISQNGSFSVTDKWVYSFTTVEDCIRFFLYGSPFSLSSYKSFAEKLDGSSDSNDSLILKITERWVTGVAQDRFLRSWHHLMIKSPNDQPTLIEMWNLADSWRSAKILLLSSKSEVADFWHSAKILPPECLWTLSQHREQSLPRQCCE